MTANSHAEDIFDAAIRRFQYVTDKTQFHTLEYWQTADEMSVNQMRGDCEDFAALCVHELRAAGLPARYVFCLTETGEGHCVAECNGDILDNRQRSVLAQNKLDYKWISISGYKPGDAWHEIITKERP